MITDHPFFGVGMDGFGDWYRRSRSPEAVKFNAGIFTDTAHNIPLDIGASGGLPLLIIYLAIVGLALYSIIKVIKRKSEFDVMFAALVAGWVAYEAQSLISINQLALGVWGWSLTGLIIGYEINTRDSGPVEVQKTLRKGKVVAEKLSAGAGKDADFYTGKIASAKFFVATVLPHITADRKIVEATDSTIMEIPESAF